MDNRTTPAGLLGQYYAARHDYGHYRSCAVSGTYTLSNPNPNDSVSHLISLLKVAIHKTISRHPALSFGMLSKTVTSPPQLYRLPTIFWEDIMSHLHVYPEEAKEDDEVARQIGIAHQHLFTDQYRKPAWRIIVLTYGERSTANGELRFDVLFVAHHAMADGTSCATFHKTLFSFLSAASTQPDPEVSWPYIVPDNLTRLPFVEEAFQLPSQATLPNPPKPEFIPWTSVSPFATPYTSRVLFLAIPNTQTSHVLKTCQNLGVTLTGLLHGLITIYLSQFVPDAAGFRAITPYSMRRFTQVSNDEIVNHISYISTNFAPTCTVIEDSPEEKATVQKIARQYQAEISSEIASVTAGHGPAEVLTISRLTDVDAYCEKSMRNRRGSTYELSNIGVIDMKNAEAKGDVGCQKLVFTQCGMVVGPAIGCGVVSVRGGMLVLSLTWQEGAVEEELIEGLNAYLERRLTGFGCAEEAWL